MEPSGSSNQLRISSSLQLFYLLSKDSNILMLTDTLPCWTSKADGRQGGPRYSSKDKRQHIIRQDMDWTCILFWSTSLHPGSPVWNPRLPFLLLLYLLLTTQAWFFMQGSGLPRLDICKHQICGGCPCSHIFQKISSNSHKSMWKSSTTKKPKRKKRNKEKRRKIPKPYFFCSTITSPSRWPHPLFRTLRFLISGTKKLAPKIPGKTYYTIKKKNFQSFALWNLNYFRTCSSFFTIGFHTLKPSKMGRTRISIPRKRERVRERKEKIVPDLNKTFKAFPKREENSLRYQFPTQGSSSRPKSEFIITTPLQTLFGRFWEDPSEKNLKKPKQHPQIPSNNYKSYHFLHIAICKTCTPNSNSQIDSLQENSFERKHYFNKAFKHTPNKIHITKPTHTEKERKWVQSSHW